MNNLNSHSIRFKGFKQINVLNFFYSKGFQLIKLLTFLSMVSSKQFETQVKITSKVKINMVLLFIGSILKKNIFRYIEIK